MSRLEIHLQGNIISFVGESEYELWDQVSEFAINQVSKLDWEREQEAMEESK